MSVIVASYQAAETLPRALESALGQTLPPNEVVVCNDGSTDETSAVLEGYRDRIIVVDQRNQGLSAARNAAIKRSSSEWVVLLDADDEWLPTRLERMNAAIGANPQVDIVTTDAIVRGPGQADACWYRKGVWPASEDDQPQAIVAGSFIFSGAAVRKAAWERIGGFRVDVGHQNEWEAWVRLVLTGSRAALVDEALAIYHQEAGPAGSQLSRNRTGTYRMMLSVIRAERGKHGEAIDAAIRKSERRISKKLAIARGVQAVRQQQRTGCLGAAFLPPTPWGLRLKFVFAAIFPKKAYDRLVASS